MSVYFSLYRTGYGFVVRVSAPLLLVRPSELGPPQEFDSRAAAEMAVTVHHEGYFMGNMIRVELSHTRPASRH
jgi:hypothetical protein